MKRNQLLLLSILLTIMCSAFTCQKDTAKFDINRGAWGLPESKYTINNVSFTGQGVNDTTLRAIVVPCSNNNTIRIYYSRSVNFATDTILNIVSSSLGGSLKPRECYIEVTTSTFDTWLSTGSGGGTVKVRKDQDFHGTNINGDPWFRDFYVFTFSDAQVQHFTSVPLNDYGKVSAELVTLKF